MNLNIQRGWNQIDYNTKRNRHVKETTPTPRIRDRDRHVYNYISIHTMHIGGTYIYINIQRGFETR